MNVNPLVNATARRTLVGLVVLGAAVLGAASAGASVSSAQSRGAAQHCAAGWKLTARRKGFVCRRGNKLRPVACRAGAARLEVSGGWLCAMPAAAPKLKKGASPGLPEVVPAAQPSPTPTQAIPPDPSPKPTPTQTPAQAPGQTPAPTPTGPAPTLPVAVDTSSLLTAAVNEGLAFGNAQVASGRFYFDQVDPKYCSLNGLVETCYLYLAREEDTVSRSGNLYKNRFLYEVDVTATLQDGGGLFVWADDSGLDAPVASVCQDDSSKYPWLVTDTTPFCTT